MKKILLLLLLFVCTGVAAQTYDAQWYLDKGNEYYKAENYDMAITYYKKANELAGGENPVCQYFIGACFAQKEEYEQMIYWFRKAAEQGNADAQYILGFYYEKGYGVAEDQAQAFNWYIKAAKQGMADAQYKVGLYFLGKTHIVDYKEQAIDWFQKAATQGNGNSMLKLGSMYLDKDKSLAKFWLTKGLNSNPTDKILAILAEAVLKNLED